MSDLEIVDAIQKFSLLKDKLFGPKFLVWELSPCTDDLDRDFLFSLQSRIHLFLMLCMHQYVANEQLVSSSELKLVLDQMTDAVINLEQRIDQEKHINLLTTKRDNAKVLMELERSIDPDSDRSVIAIANYRHAEDELITFLEKLLPPLSPRSPAANSTASIASCASNLSQDPPVLASALPSPVSSTAIRPVPLQATAEPVVASLLSALNAAADSSSLPAEAAALSFPSVPANSAPSSVPADDGQVTETATSSRARQRKRKQAESCHAFQPVSQRSRSIRKKAL